MLVRIRKVQVLHAQSYKSVFMLSTTEDNWRYYDALSFTQQPRQVLSSALTKATQNHAQIFNNGPNGLLISAQRKTSSSNSR